MKIEQTDAGNIKLTDIILNRYGLYEGVLSPYFRAVFKTAKNLLNPYHNFRHLFHTVWLCYDAARFYVAINKMSKREVRNLLIAAMFHDFDHSGRTGQDDLEIERALRGLRRYIQPEDQPFLEEISDIIRFSEFPHKAEGQKLPLAAQILQDADLCQSLSNIWLQQTLWGLSTETGLSPLQILEKQEEFLRSLHFNTEWAHQRFPAEMIEEQISEVNTLLSIVK